ncbi:LOW QUALITY PROTEIN: hypothetical protein V2J09_018406 [Rumex salicifolius]
MVQKRLDRVFLNSSGRLKWGEAYVQHLLRVCSDHNPLLIHFEGRPPFRFQTPLHVALDDLKGKLGNWNKEVFGDVHQRKERLSYRIDKKLVVQPSDYLLRLNEELKSELELTLEQEELIWFQKSRQQWITHGDKNTKFFHMYIIIRRRRNQIIALKTDGNTWCLDPINLERHALNYFRNLYAPDDLEELINMPREGETFRPIIDKIQARLVGWKARTLSMDGRVTLVHSVLSALPIATCDEMDRICREFGSTDSHKCMNLVAWPDVCKPRKLGRLGIRMTKDSNLAMISRLSWRLFSQPDQLWARVLLAKYRGTNIRGASEMSFRGPMHTFGRIYGWVIQDYLGNVSDQEMRVKVKDYWVLGSSWNWPILSTKLPASTLLQLAGIGLAHHWEGKDQMAWRGTSSGRFSTASAYALLRDIPMDTTDYPNLFRILWKIKAAERIKLFGWKVLKRRILTNAERVRRHLAINSLCGVCSRESETLLHLLRDYHETKPKIVPLNHWGVFSSLTLGDWLEWNLKPQGSKEDVGAWRTVFLTMIWWAWKWRNNKVFKDEEGASDKLKFIMDRAKEYGETRDLSEDFRTETGRVVKMIGWKAPEQGWLKLNYDGAVKGAMGMATAGGVIGDHCGSWVCDFNANLGILIIL